MTARTVPCSCSSFLVYISKIIVLFSIRNPRDKWLELSDAFVLEKISGAVLSCVSLQRTVPLSDLAYNTKAAFPMKCCQVVQAL